MSFADALNQGFESFMTYRETVGYATATYRSTVPPFIIFCTQNYPDEESISQDMVDAWLAHYGYSHNSQAAFISLLREFTRYLNFLGRKDYVPDDDYNIGRIAYIPYLFTDKELTTLFNGFDSYIGVTSGKRFSPEAVLPVYSRLLFCCGLRPQEPPSLLKKDVNLISGDIYIRQSKRHKDRHIIMSDDMRRLCAAYDQFSNSERTWFFQRSDGKPYQASWFTYMFNRVWELTGLVSRGNPRPYDLRHAFASRNIIRWLNAGRDTMELLTYLSAYMGHDTLSSTLYYIHLLPEKLRSASGIDWDFLSKIYGGGPENED